MRLVDATINASNILKHDSLFRHWMMNEIANGRRGDYVLPPSYQQPEDAANYPSYEELSDYILYERIVQHLVKESGLSVAEVTRELALLLEQYQDDNHDSEDAFGSSELKQDSSTCDYLSDGHFFNSTEGLQLSSGDRQPPIGFQFGLLLLSIVLGWLIFRWWRRDGEKILGRISSNVSQRRQAAIIKELLDSEGCDNKLKPEISSKGGHQQKSKKKDRRNKNQNSHRLTAIDGSNNELGSNATTEKVQAGGAGDIREFYLLQERDTNRSHGKRMAESQDTYSLTFDFIQGETKDEIIYSPQRHGSINEPCFGREENCQCCQCDVCKMERELFRLIIEKSLDEGVGCTFSVDSSGQTTQFVVNGPDNNDSAIINDQQYDFGQDEIRLAQKHTTDRLIMQDSCVSTGVSCLSDFLLESNVAAAG